MEGVVLVDVAEDPGLFVGDTAAFLTNLVGEEAPDLVALVVAVVVRAEAGRDAAAVDDLDGVDDGTAADCGEEDVEDVDELDSDSLEVLDVTVADEDRKTLDLVDDKAIEELLLGVAEDAEDADAILVLVDVGFDGVRLTRVVTAEDGPFALSTAEEEDEAAVGSDDDGLGLLALGMLDLVGLGMLDLVGLGIPDLVGLGILDLVGDGIRDGVTGLVSSEVDADLTVFLGVSKPVSIEVEVSAPVLVLSAVAEVLD